MIQQDEGYHINLQISIIYNCIQQHWAIKTLNWEKTFYLQQHQKKNKIFRDKFNKNSTRHTLKTVKHHWGKVKNKASLVAQLVKNSPAMWETWVRSLGRGDPWRRERLPTPVFWPGEFHEQRHFMFMNWKTIVLRW